MSRYMIFALAALAACSGPDDKTESGETGDTTAPLCPDGTFDGPTVITDYSVTCDATDNVRYFVETEGWTTNGRVFAQETANAEPQYSDEHVLTSYEFDECQFWDRLEAVLTTGADLPAGETETVFSCANHFEDPLVMSYAAEVYDLNGDPADCVAWGDDPEAMIAGTATRVNPPTIAIENCEVGARAM